MKNIKIRPSAARMLMPGLTRLFPNSSTALTPSAIRSIRLGTLPYSSKKNRTLPEKIPPVVVVRMAKGGVGKTTVIGNVGSALAMMGHKVLLVDGDPQASLSGLMGVDWRKEGLVHIGHLMSRFHQNQNLELDEAIEHIYQDGHLDLIPADITLADADRWLGNTDNYEQLFLRMLSCNTAFFSRYDCILVDTAPATSLLTNTLMLATREVVAVTLLEGSSIQAMQVLAANIEEFNTAYPGLGMSMHIVANGWHGSYKSCQECLQALATEFPGQICDIVLSNSAAFKRQISPFNNGDSGTVMEREPNSDIATAIAELTRTLADRYKIQLDAKEGQATQQAEIEA